MPRTAMSTDESRLFHFIESGWGWYRGLSASDLPTLLYVELLEKLDDDPQYCVQRVDEYLSEQERLAAAPAARQEAAEAFKLARRRVGARAGSIGRAAPAWQRLGQERGRPISGALLNPRARGQIG